nr:AlNc14C603G12228 [Albugo laibachii Nc14]|eukprot:CCA27615.1 AlNc14C603G12228 [Albugo laibachii Nc14]
MEIDNVQMMNRDDCLRQCLCLNGQKPGHHASVCRTQLRQGKVAESLPVQNHCNQQHTQRSRRSSPIVELDSSIMEEVEQPIVYDNAEFNAVKLGRKSKLYDANGWLDGKEVRILIDTRASTNLIKRGLANKIMKMEVVEAQRFDGRRKRKQVHEVGASCEVQGKKVEDVLFTE